VGTEACLALLASLLPRVAVYPGSFNPFHRGHLSILRQTERVFDKVIIGAAVNRQKPGANATLTQRREELQARLCFHEVVEIPALLTDFIEAFPLPLSVVRGVRDGTDLEAELRYARFLAELRPGTNVVWIGCEAELQHLSSSAIRELESISPSSGLRYVPQTQDIYGLPSP
jgi:pantetheine-phosphate adenylyltransferase